MTDMNDPRAAAAPGFGAFIGSDDNDNQTDRENPEEGGGKSRSPSGKAVAEKGESAAKPRRRRGSRGGRRRSGAADSKKSKEADGEPTAESVTPEASGGESKTAEAKPRRKRAARRTTRKDGEARASRSKAEKTEEADAPTTEEPKRSSRRSVSRPGRTTRKKAVAASDDDAESRSSDEAVEAEETGASPRAGSRSRRKRPVRRRKKATPEKRVDAATSETQGEEPSDDASASEDGSSTKKTRRRRGTRGGRKRRKTDTTTTRKTAAAVFEVIPGEEDDLPSLPELPEEVETLDSEETAARETTRAKKTARKKGSRKKVSGDEVEEVEEEKTRTTRKKKSDVVPDQQILVNACDREEVRVAVVRDGTILDFQMNVEKDKSLVGDIYRGRVVNIEASIGAAFIDFGRGRNGFLHTSDVLPAYGEAGWSLSKLLQVAVDPDDLDEESSSLMADELDFEESAEGDKEEGDAEPKGKTTKKPARGRKKKATRRRFRPRRPIREILKVGDKVVVQVTKDAIGDKGPTLTTYLSIPGRYLVLTPSMTHRGVSRKIEDVKERRRLRRILDALNVSEGMGVIARTAASGQTKVELKRDLDYLLGAWRRFSKRLDAGHGPMTLYQESDVAIRTVRDLFGPETESVMVDDQAAFQKIFDFAELLMPDHVERFKLHDEPRPLFHHHGVEQDFERIFTRRIELPSGGSIVFDQAEALVAIDVNSGKTRTASFDFEEIALKTNMEAVPEIARQIRLRDLGGILVVDFIDMMKMANRRIVERAFRGELASDRARSKVGRISQFGLLEMTRQRLGPGMSKKLFTNCPACRGVGKLRTAPSRAAAILRRLGSALTLKGFSTVEIRAQQEVLDYLKKEHAGELKALEEEHNRKLLLTAVPEQIEDSVLRYLRADGREVRPGGRRKR